MSIKKIIQLLKDRETPFLEIDVYSKLPGIYAIFYIGNNFPVLGGAINVR